MGQMTTTDKKPDVYAALASMRHESKANLNKFLKFDGRSGRYSVRDGDDKDDIDLGTKLAVNILACKKGWICFKAKTVEDELMVSMFSVDPLPNEEDLEDHGPYNEKAGEGWRKQFSFMLKDLENGQQYIFNNSSKSGVSELGKFLQAVIDQRQSYPVEQYTPVVELDAKEWTSADGNLNYKPILNIVDWVENPQAEFVVNDSKATKRLGHVTDADAGADASADEKDVHIPE